MMKKRCLIFVLFSVWFSVNFNLFGQERSLFSSDKDKKKDPLVKVSVRKSGPYFGIQQGAYTFGELGGEMQFKRIKLKNPTTHAINAGALYNISNNVLGFNTGAWRKPGRFDFTYGINLAYRTDFDQHRFGGGPVVGYKVFGFHVLAGYDFLSNGATFTETNNLYLSARFLLVNERKTTWEWRKKEDKKKSKK